MATPPIPVSLRLPDLNHRGYSDRVLAFHKGEWHIGRYYPGGPTDAPRWILEGDSSLLNEVTHWMPLPGDPTANLPAAWTEPDIMNADARIIEWLSSDDAAKTLSGMLWIARDDTKPHGVVPMGWPSVADFVRLRYQSEILHNPPTL